MKPTDETQLERERDYYRRQIDEISGEMVRRDYEISALRHTLKQREQGFALLSDLQQFVGGQESLGSIFCYVVQNLNSVLGMDKSLMLTRRKDGFAPETWIGCSARAWNEAVLSLDESQLSPRQTLLVHGETPRSDLIESIRSTFDLPFFILQPIAIETELLGVLLCGRQTERKPFAPPLNEVDVDTLQSVGALIGAVVSQRNSALLRADNASLREMVTIDKLTGILNRRGFEESLSSEWQRAARNGTPLSLILLDVDRFKSCNDTYGHDVGDVILRQIAQRVTHSLRPGDVGARYGGEEFAVLLPETDATGALSVAERIRQRIEFDAMQHQITPNATFHTASLGICTLAPDQLKQTQLLIGGADKALYRAKNEGRNCVRVAD